MNFITEHYFIFTYNIGLIIAMAYTVRFALKANGHSDSEVIGILVASLIWPAMIFVNFIAVLFSKMRDTLNRLITLQETEQEVQPDATAELEAEDVDNTNT